MLVGYITVGTKDLSVSGAFYDELLSLLGARRVMTDERMLGWGSSAEDTMFSVILPFDQKEATVGNGTHIAFNAESRAAVDAFHATALAAGGADEGPPGLRPHYHADYYGAYVRDLDGNKLQAVCHLPE